jgi:hypothetical protein
MSRPGIDSELTYHSCRADSEQHWKQLRYDESALELVLACTVMNNFIYLYLPDSINSWRYRRKYPTVQNRWSPREKHQYLNDQ